MKAGKQRYHHAGSDSHSVIHVTTMHIFCSLCPSLPIDIVYTWVNGSDPVLLSELNALKRTLERYGIIHVCIVSIA